MQTVIIVIHLMVVIALVAVILLQRSEGGALGIGGGGGFMAGRGQSNARTRATGRAPTSVLDRVAPGQSVPAGGDLLDQLKRIDQQAPAAPAVPEPPRPGQ